MMCFWVNSLFYSKVNLWKYILIKPWNWLKLVVKYFMSATSQQFNSFLFLHQITLDTLCIFIHLLHRDILTLVFYRYFYYRIRIIMTSVEVIFCSRKCILKEYIYIYLVINFPHMNMYKSHYRISWYVFIIWHDRNQSRIV